jgi:hypothetical protein
VAEIIPPARVTSDHARHDALLIAAHAAGDLEGVERSRAEQLVAACHECTALERDLRAIALATTAANLPVPPRPRSFTLEPTDAARIRPSGWRGLIRRFASPDLSFTRPLAAGLTTLGLAGLLVAALPGGLSSLGGSAAAPAPAYGPAQERELSGAAASAAPSVTVVPQASPAGQADPTQVTVPRPSSLVGTHADQESGKPSPTEDRFGAFNDDGDRGDQTGDASLEVLEVSVAQDGPSMLVVLAGTSLLVGLGLFGLRWAARRLG